MSDFIEVDGKKYFEESYLDLISRQRDSARTQLAACLEFLATEAGWEEFRAEMLYHDNLPKQRTSQENARKLRNFLAAQRGGTE